MPGQGAGITLEGVSARIGGRHAFVHERVLEVIADGTAERGFVSFSKAELSRALGCCPRSLDRAVSRLRRDGLVVSEPSFDGNGGQLGNVYRATEEGRRAARGLRSRASSPEDPA